MPAYIWNPAGKSQPSSTETTVTTLLPTGQGFWQQKWRSVFLTALPVCPQAAQVACVSIRYLL